jgi:flagellar biogenesis protein FliO
MTLASLQQLQARIAAVETALMKRENVIRFLVVRLLLMLAMVVGFWAAMRQIA